MSLKAKLGDTWKETKSLHVKVNGEWKDISKLYSKKDGAWFVVFSGGGAIIEFLDYPYAIPVMKGWEYSTDGVTWTTVEPVMDFSNMTYTWTTDTLEYSNSEGQITAVVTYVKFEISGFKIDERILGKTISGKIYADIVTDSGTVSRECNCEIKPTGEIYVYLMYINSSADQATTAIPVSDATITKIEFLDSSTSVYGEVYPSIDLDVWGPILEISGKVGNWDFSKYYTYFEAGMGGWSALTLPSGSIPEITKIVVTSIDGATSENEIDMVDPSSAYPVDGTQLSLATHPAAWDSLIARIDYYAGDTYLGTSNQGSENADGWYECEATYPPFTGYVKTKGELLLTEYYDETETQNFTTGDWDLSGATFEMNSAFGGVTVLGIVGTTPEFGSMLFYAEDSDYLGIYPDGQELLPQYQSSYDTDGANGVYLTSGTMWMNSSNRSATLLGTDGTPIARWSEVPDKQMAHIPVTEGSTYGFNDWDLSGFSVALENDGSSTPTFGADISVSGIVGSIPEVSRVYAVYGSSGTYLDMTITDNNPNVTGYGGIGAGSTDYVVLYDSAGNVVADSRDSSLRTYEPGTASVSEVLTFDSKVSGTINYVAGDLTPSVQITVTDDSGNVIEGAEITFLSNDWDLSNASVSTVSGATNTISGITGSNPIVTTMVIVITEEVEKTLDVSDNNPNMIYQGSIPTSLTTVGIRLLDADGNTVAYRSDVPRTLS